MIKFFKPVLNDKPIHTYSKLELDHNWCGFDRLVSCIWVVYAWNVYDDYIGCEYAREMLI